MKSTIKTLNPNLNNPDSGWGFIKNPDAAAAKNFYFTQAALKGIKFSQLTLGMKVEFEIIAGPKGPQARNVRAIDKIVDEEDAEFVRLMEEDFEEDRAIYERKYGYRDRERLKNIRFHDADLGPF